MIQRRILGCLRAGMCSIGTVWTDGSRRAAITAPRVARRCEANNSLMFSLGLANSVGFTGREHQWPWADPYSLFGLIRGFWETLNRRTRTDKTKQKTH
jgi:hypothetical protein